MATDVQKLTQWREDAYEKLNKLAQGEHSVTVGSRSYTRNDMADLQQYIGWLDGEIAKAQGAIRPFASQARVGDCYS
jgi:hypothetical protein